MTRSALAIEPYLCEMALISRRHYPNQPLRERLAVVGREAEYAVFKATSGSNAHKGAIWILGLRTSAAAMLDEDQAPASTTAGTANKIASFVDRATHWQRWCFWSRGQDIATA
jgi:triphosphoribosyl-dephospho-CoA synthase